MTNIVLNANSFQRHAAEEVKESANADRDVNLQRDQCSFLLMDAQPSYLHAVLNSNDIMSKFQLKFRVLQKKKL